MSSLDNTSVPSSRRFTIRCDAVEVEPQTSSGCERHLDPAVLIGLSLAYARRRAAVPSAIALPLTELAIQGDPACRLVADWIKTRLISTAATSKARGHARSRFPGTAIIAATEEGIR
jgi:hypothetical protein